MNMKKLKIGLLIGLLGYLFIAQTTNAKSLSLSINPPIIEISALAPSTATSSLTIQNKSNDQVVLQIQLKPFKAKLENGELEYLEASSGEYLKNSLFLKNVQILDNGIPTETITLGPTQEKNLTLNINIPQDTTISRLDSPDSSSARRADYYFSVIFVSDNNASPTSNASLNQLGIAANVLLSVGAKETPNAVLQEFSSGLFFEKGPVSFTVRITNKGIHFIKPKGEILIKNMFGQSIGKLDLIRVNVLADATRGIPNDLYMQQSSLDLKNPKALWKEDFLLGFYTATLNIALSDEGPSFIKSIHFFAFPFQGLIVIVIVLISAIIIVNRVRTHMKK